MTYPEDDAILRLIRDDSTRNEGFRWLVSKYKKALYFHIRRMVDTHEDTDDVLQNTFLKIVKGIDGFQSQSALYTWLYRIATNECLNFIQQNKNKHHVEFESWSGTQETTGDISETKVLHYLDAALRTLPDKQKLVFNMRYYDEMPYQDIADITGTSIGALKASYHLAVKKIEEYIKSNI